MEIGYWPGTGTLCVFGGWGWWERPPTLPTQNTHRACNRLAHHCMSVCLWSSFKPEECYLMYVSRMYEECQYFRSWNHREQDYCTNFLKHDKSRTQDCAVSSTQSNLHFMQAWSLGRTFILILTVTTIEFSVLRGLLLPRDNLKTPWLGLCTYGSSKKGMILCTARKDWIGKVLTWSFIINGFTSLQ